MKYGHVKIGTVTVSNIVVYAFFFIAIFFRTSGRVMADSLESDHRDLGYEYSKIVNIINQSGHDALPTIRELLNSPDFVIKAAAFKSLSADPFQCSDVEPLVAPYLETGHSLLRSYAVRSLIRHKCHGHKELIRGLLDKENDETLKRVYIEYFSQVGEKGDISILETVQNDIQNSMSMRLLAAKAIAVLGGRYDRALVNSALSSREDQRQAIRVLAFSSNPEDVSKLAPFLVRQDELRDEAKVAIGRITIVGANLSVSEKKMRLFQYLSDDSERVRFWTAEQLLALSSVDPSILSQLKDIATSPNHKAYSSVAAVLTVGKVFSDDELLKTMEETRIRLNSQNAR